jgi:NADH-quinone oxidoreductase subunit D
MTERTVGIGAAAAVPGETEDTVLAIGPQHPSAHGALRLRLTLDGERIVAAEPIVGFLHRGAEKLFEVRDYRQIIMLANRHDWLSAFANELGVVLAVERMLGMAVPERAVWARTLLAELNRVLSHLMFLSVHPLDLGSAPPGLGVAEREELRTVLEEATGGRMHYMFNRVGGLKEDLPEGWLDHVTRAVAAVRRRLPDYEERILADPAFRERTVGIGRLGRETILQYGMTGPIARASGVAFDLRRDDPYLAYGELKVTPVTETAGDCHARFRVLLRQVEQSLTLAEACTARLRELPGPVNQRLPKVLRVPEGHTYAWTESPLGVNGYYLVSRGDTTPWRLKLRSASFNNVQALREVLPGHTVADLVPILGSMFFVVGDIDK